MNIREIMTSPPVVCKPDDDLSLAAHLMWTNDCGALPVIDDKGHAVGMITDRDISMSAYTQGKRLADIPVSTAMSETIASCRDDDTLEVAERVMAENQVRRVPIVDADERPVGIVSINDIVRYDSIHLSNGKGRPATQLLARICRPRDAPEKLGRKEEKANARAPGATPRR